MLEAYDQLTLEEAPSKRCSKCSDEQPLSAFHSDASRVDGLAFWCKGCQKVARDGRPTQVSSDARKTYQRQYARDRFKSDPEVRARIERRKSDLRKFVDDLKRGKPCLDCGAVHEPFVMDFDHRDPSTKIGTISRMMESSTKEAILAEVEKCDLVCSNCHRYRTFGRRSPCTKSTKTSEP